MLFNPQGNFFWEVIKILSSYWQLWLVTAIIIFGIFVFRAFLGRKQEPIGYLYRSKQSIMTRHEQEFFKLLVEIVDNRYYVFPQVHLDAILDHKIPGQSWFGAFRHINEKSVDFVICDKISETPLLAIELDDRSHEREDRINRDLIVNNIFKNASFPLQRFSSQEALDRTLVREKVLSSIILKEEHYKPVS